MFASAHIQRRDSIPLVPLLRWLTEKSVGDGLFVISVAMGVSYWDTQIVGT